MKPSLAKAILAIIFLLVLSRSESALCEFGKHTSEIGSEETGGNSFESYEESIEEAKKKHIKQFKGFGMYRSRIQSACKLLEAEGQRQWFFDTAKKFSNIKDCQSCRSLYVTFVGACAGKTKTKVSAKKEKTPVVEEPSETHEVATEEGTPVAKPTVSEKNVIRGSWDPSTELLDLISRIFREMAEDEEVAEENFKAVKHLTDNMRDPIDKKIDQKQYLDTLATYMLSPFIVRGIGVEEAESQGHEGGGAPAKPTVALDSLF